MHERLTISESKGTFHKDFPYVIPAIYRKVIDEYLVELNLLKNQSSFKEDGVFVTNEIDKFVNEELLPQMKTVFPNSNIRKETIGEVIGFNRIKNFSGRPS